MVLKTFLKRVGNCSTMRRPIYSKLLFLFSFLITFGTTRASNSFPGIVKLDVETHVLHAQESSTLHTQKSSTFKFLGIPVTIITISNTYPDVTEYYSDTTYFKFYDHPSDPTPVKQLSFYDEQNKSFATYKSVERDIENWLNPEILEGDSAHGYSNIFLLCKSRQGDWLEVIVNKETGETLWIKNKKRIEFISWKKLFHDPLSGAVRSKYEAQHRMLIYISPDTNAPLITYNETNCFNVNKIKGNWLRIDNHLSELCDNDDRSPEVENGWIEFINSEGLLIQIVTSF